MRTEHAHERTLTTLSLKNIMRLKTVAATAHMLSILVMWSACSSMDSSSSLRIFPMVDVGFSCCYDTMRERERV